MGKKICKKITASLLGVVMAVSFTGAGTLTASAFDTSYISKDGMQLGYNIVNGYTKMYFRHNPDRTEGRVAVYAGVDISKTYTLAMGGLYVLTRGIDIDRFISDNDYATSFIADFDSYLKSKGIENEQSKKFKESVKNDNLKFEQAYETVGFYFFDCSTDYARKLINDNDYADFVLVDGKIPSNMKDLNFDGKTDMTDAGLIQHYLAHDFYMADSDEAAYAEFACDYNGDESIDIIDVTDLERKLAR